MMTTEEYEAKSTEISLEWNARTREQKNAEPLWRLYAESDARNEWAEFLHQEYAPEFTAAAAKVIFDKAWEDRHSEGLNSVAWAYEELVEFIQKVNGLNS